MGKVFVVKMYIARFAADPSQSNGRRNGYASAVVNGNGGNSNGRSGPNIYLKDLLHFSYRGRGKNKEQVFSWVLVKCYKKIFYDKMLDGKNIMEDILKDIKYAENNQFNISKLKEFQSAKEVLFNMMK